jgi:hypothetical protein
MHYQHANAITGVGIAFASLGGLFAEAQPGSIGVWGSVLALCLLLVRAGHEVALRWIDWQRAKIDSNELKTRITELEHEAANNLRLAAAGVCPLNPTGTGTPFCVRPPDASSSALPPVQ